MKLLELFKDEKPGGKEDTNDNGDFLISKVIGDREITFSAKKGSRNTWEIHFHEYDKETGKTTYEKSGSGDEIKVFTFVLNATRDFIKKKDPKRIEFFADKVDDSRVGLYRRFVKRFAGDYISREFEVGLGSAKKQINFDLIKKTPVAEALDKPLKFEVEEETDDYYQVSFESNGREIMFEADKIFQEYEDDEEPGPESWTLSFVERVKNGMTRWDITKGGKEFEVFATLKSIIETFIKKYKPVQFEFTADKGEGSRASLYHRLFTKMLPSNYEIARDDKSSNQNSKFKVTKK